MINDGKTLEMHKYICGWCDKEFESDSRSQLVAVRRHNAVYCSKECKNKRNNAQPGPHAGVCVNCGSGFRSRTKGKRYCSMKCYIESPETIERLRLRNEEAASKRPNCPQCGGKTKTKRKFCSTLCQRRFFDERFDRFIASPETLALPQNYDEFFCKDELPCIIEGCDWVGHRLGYHCNIVHGIDVVKLRELAGFNRRTGTVSAPEQQRLSDQGKTLFEDGKTGHAFLEMQEEIKNGERERPQSNPSDTLESREHRRKAAALRRAVIVTRVCNECEREYESTALAHGSLFCSVKCRSVGERERRRQGVSEEKCSYCGEIFIANQWKADRVRNGHKVTCSDLCRNRMNIAECLSQQGRRVPSSR